MSLDEPRHSPSPTGSSGRASPAPRAPRRQLEEEPRRQDKSYRRYATGIERALAAFDATRLEWPDYISFLGRLLKAIQSHPPAVDSLPHKSAVAYRLAQCLRPSLPSGVHQKAIEVYSYIFSVVGKQSLALDLYVYLPGLLPVFTFASLTVRPAFLALLETHIVALDGAALRPALKALILGLLPGLEDETSEDFDRTLKIVDSLKETISTGARDTDLGVSARHDEYFWQCFFLASISSSSRRQGALAFLVRRLPRLVDPHASSETSRNGSLHVRKEESLTGEAQAVISPEPGLLIRCLAAGLEDNQMLVQRGYLDLLLTHLPLHSPVLTESVESDDLVHLVAAATTVVIRRDMSLNRRLWAWFLGPDVTDDEDDASSEALRPTASKQATKYFIEYGAEPLVSAISNMLEQNHTIPAARAKPFRICLSLMDHREIGGVVVPQIFLSAMENTSSYSKQSSDSDFRDVLRSASSFFDGIESGTIWGQMLKLTALELTSSRTTNILRLEKLKLAQFITSNFNIQDEEMLYFHVPLVLLALISAISQYSSESNTNDDEVFRVLDHAFQLAEQLVQILPDRLQLNSSFAQKDAAVAADSDTSTQLQIISLVEKFYIESHGMLSLSPPPFSSKSVSETLLSESANLFLSKTNDILKNEIGSARDIGLQAKLLSSLLSKLPNPEVVNIDQVIGALNDVFVTNVTTFNNLDFIYLKSISQLLITLSSHRDTFSDESEENFFSILSSLAEVVWDCLSPEFPKYHLEAVRCLWQLDELVPGEPLVEALTAKCLVNIKGGESRYVSGIEAAKKFSVLWSHTPTLHGGRFRAVAVSQNHDSNHEEHNYQRRLFRPLCLLLDASDESQSEMQYFLKSWLHGLSNMDRIFDILISNIASTRTSLSANHSPVTSLQAEHDDSSSLCLYYMQRLASLLEIAPENTWTMLSQPLEGKAVDAEDDQASRTLLEILAHECLSIVQDTTLALTGTQGQVRNELLRMSLSILRKSLESPQSIILQRLKLEDPLIVILRRSLKPSFITTSSQLALLDTLFAALKVRNLDAQAASRSKFNLSRLSMENARNLSKLSLPHESLDISSEQQLMNPPADLIKCIQEGLTLNLSVHVLDRWIQFLSDILPLLSSALFQFVIPLVEALCQRIRKMFHELKHMFAKEGVQREIPPEAALMALLSGLELTLTAGHEQLAREEPKKSGPRSPEPQQGGFFGTVVSGVFSSDAQKNRSSAANTRLTVILCFQDALRVCLDIWSWGGQTNRAEERDRSCLASYAYVSQRLRNKTRRMLDRMFTTEALECLETLIVIWTTQEQSQGLQSSSSISLLHVLEGSSPKRTIPAIFNAIYSRTIPSSIDVNWMSTLTSDLTEYEISQFLIQYTHSLDDDAMDEIWTDCMTFLRDVLTNPLPHHQILPLLLVFIVILAEKVDKTNFGEQRKMRKDLADLFLRHLTAAFTTRSGGSYQEVAHSRTNSELHDASASLKRRHVRKPQYLDFVEVLANIVPRLSAVLTDADRLSTAVSNIATNVITPLVHAKAFPANAKAEYLVLWLSLMKITAAAKILKKDLSEAFLHAKFFSISASLARSHWSPLLYQWTLSDKDRIGDIFSRVSAPTSAGIMFGVGANAARLEADKKTQLHLRRIAFLILSAEEDHAVPTMATIEEKVVDLLNATTASSPSSETRAEVFMVLRALVLNTNSLHLSSLWPIATFELQKALGSSLSRSAEFDTYNTNGLLQACKFLDLLVTLEPDDFQVHEWLFITDTIDAVYRPTNWEPVALADDLADELGTAPESLPASPILRKDRRSSTNLSTKNTDTSSMGPKYRTPLLAVLGGSQKAATDMPKEDFVMKILRPFFAQLSLHAYESTYDMKPVDIDSCKAALVEDLFDDSTLVG